MNRFINTNTQTSTKTDTKYTPTFWIAIANNQTQITTHNWKYGCYDSLKSKNPQQNVHKTKPNLTTNQTHNKIFEKQNKQQQNTTQTEFCARAQIKICRW